jgi:hypothetical protein
MLKLNLQGWSQFSYAANGPKSSTKEKIREVWGIT